MPGAQDYLIGLAEIQTLVQRARRLVTREPVGSAADAGPLASAAG